MSKIKSKVFPETEKYNDLKYDNEGLWSITHPEDADLISEIIKKFVKEHENQNVSDLVIFEGTAGLGGNIFSFSKYFKKTIGVELDEKRFEMLKSNLSCYNFDNVEVINGDCINYLKNDYDIYFFDPPWGGPKYKSKESIDLYLGNYNLTEVVNMIPKNKYIVFKLPFNFNLNLLKDYDLLIKKLGNILIIILVN
jgi:16S rRNA G966 N2-methylase RsmD